MEPIGASGVAILMVAGAWLLFEAKKAELLARM